MSSLDFVNFGVINLGIINWGMVVLVMVSIMMLIPQLKKVMTDDGDDAVW